LFSIFDDIANQLRLIGPGVGRDTDKVEAAGALPGFMGIEPCLCGPAEPFFFDGREGFVRALKAMLGSGLDLYENDGLPVLGYDVQFEMS
jgi:hypothetical protein